MAPENDLLAPTAAVVLVPWPEDAEQRNRCAAAGTCCVLVVAPGTVPPTVVDGEDWVYRSADERDVAARIDRLRRIGRVPAKAPLELLAVPLRAGEQRVASRLLASCGRLVPRNDLPDEDLDGVIDRLREAVASDGWRIHAIGGSGFLLERPEDSRP